MTRFNKTKVDTVAATVEVGAGRTWDQVYAELESYGVNVVGGRVPGVGVGGVALGGGKHLSPTKFGLWSSFEFEDNE
jgi:FAD/FMN-containing dehydrogenase